MNKTISSSSSISRNLSVSLVLVLAGVITAAVIAHYLVISSNDIKELDNKADELISNLQKSLELPIWNFDRESLNKIVDAYFLSNIVSEIVVTEGITQSVIIEKEEQDAFRRIRRTRDVTHGGDIIARITIGLTTKYHQERVRKMILFYMAISAALIVVCILVTGFLLRVFLKLPFQTLTHGLDRLSAGDYSHRLDQVRYKEFSEIVSKFEHMAAQIQEREKSLSRAKNYISDIFNSIDSVLVGVDAGGRITHWNSKAEKLSRMSLEEAKGQSFHSVFPEFRDHAGLIQESLDRELYQKDLRITVPDNDGARHYILAVSSLTFEGERGAVIRINDVSERVRLEEMMIQTEKMLSVGGLAAGMAHEINNPLAGILQNIQVIENRLSMDTIPANVEAASQWNTTMQSIRGYMETRGVMGLLSSVRQAGDRAARIVENMLSFSRKSSSGLLSADLRTVVDDTLELAANDYVLKKNYDFRNIVVVKQYPEEPVEIPCDVSKMQQVILNILKNGAHAMSENKNRESDAPRFVIRIRKQGKTGIVEIEDNGPGMDETTRKRVFEPFFTTKPVGVGTGLGLSVSYFIVTENHGGSLTAESSPGHGSTFIISLPETQSGRPGVSDVNIN